MTMLPPGWTETTLDEISSTSLGKMLDRGKDSIGHMVPYLRNVNVQWGRIDLKDVLTMDIGPEEQGYFRLESGDLLICEGGEVGRCAIWPGGTGYMAYQKALHRVRPYQGIDVRFLRYYMEYMSVLGLLLPYSTGSTIKHLPQQQLRRLPIHLPPTAEQRRIVAALDDYFSRLDFASSILGLAQRKQQVLARRVIDVQVDSLSAMTRALSSVLREPLINGRSVPTDDNGFPVLRLTALREGKLALSERKGGRWTAANAAPFLVSKGDFFVSRGNGSLSLVGRGALLEEEPDLVAFPDTMVRVRVDAQTLCPEFLRLVWGSRSVRRQIEGMARTTAGIYKINQSMIECIEIPVPPLDLQRRIVGEVCRKVEAVYSINQELRLSAVRAQRLRRTLLAKAFVGRLVKQNATDEPATVLLERIRGGRAAARADRRARRGKVGVQLQKEKIE